jgi:hypothetical protein
MGWSLRRIAAHEQVGLSAEMVRKILAPGPPVALPDDGEIVTLRSPDPDPDRRPPVTASPRPIEETGLPTKDQELASVKDHSR